MSNQKGTFRFFLGKDNLTLATRNWWKGPRRLEKKSTSQKRLVEKRKLERYQIKVAKKMTESDIIKINEKVCIEVSGKEPETC